MERTVTATMCGARWKARLRALRARSRLDARTEKAVTGIVEDVLDLHPLGSQHRGNFVAGIGLFEIAWNHDRRGTACSGDFAGQFRQAIRAARHEGEAMAV